MDVGIIGLGAMGIGMAKNLIQSKHKVYGFDLSAAANETLDALGGYSLDSAKEVASKVDVLIVMVINGEQAKTVLFDNGAASELKQGSVILLCSTILPKVTEEIGEKLSSMNLKVIDCPVSGGKTGADNGQLTIMASGADEAFIFVQPVFDAISKKVYQLGSKVGLGSTYKVVHQLAAGVHLAAMAEIMALGVRAGCDAHQLYDIVHNSAGNSWMFSDRVPSILKKNYEPRSAVDIFVKDMNLVLETGKELCMPLPLAAVAQQLFTAASSAGYGKLNDAAIVKIYEDLTKMDIAENISGR